jgi:XTP/dITP diphosphohydrolase
MQLVFASNNKNKIQEIQALVPPNFKILSLEDIGCFEEIPETADTIEGNAILKANYVTLNYGYPCFADDTGLEVDALNGAPGVYSARYAGEQKSAEDNMNKVLLELRTATSRKAHFKTVICLNNNGLQHLFTGIISGTITTEKIGTNGFGYDPIFMADNQTLTNAQLTKVQKNEISHRRKALDKMIAMLG